MQAADRAVQACLESLPAALVLQSALATARRMAFASDRAYASSVLARAAPECEDALFACVVKAALEWKDEALGGALYEARPDVVSGVVQGLSEGQDREQASHTIGLVEPAQDVGHVVRRLAKLLTDGNADQRKLAVDELVALRVAGTCNDHLTSILNPAQLRLVDIFERRRHAGVGM
jgi:hypothetical protein